METTSGVIRNFQCVLRGTTYTTDLLVFCMGRYDVDLGDLWVKTLRLVPMYFNAMTMSFYYQGIHHLLRGVSKEFKHSSTKVANK